MGIWDGEVGPQLEVDEESMSATSEVVCSLPAWSWERWRKGVSIAIIILGGN